MSDDIEIGRARAKQPLNFQSYYFHKIPKASDMPVNTYIHSGFVFFPTVISWLLYQPIGTYMFIYLPIQYNILHLVLFG